MKVSRYFKQINSQLNNYWLSLLAYDCKGYWVIILNQQLLRLEQCKNIKEIRSELVAALRDYRLLGYTVIIKLNASC